MPTQTLNVVIYPPKEVREYTISLSESLKSYGGFILDDVRFFPHITMYLAEYPSDVIGDIREILTQVIPNLSPVLLKPTEYSIKSGYVAIGYEKTEELEMMQTAIISACNHLRKGALRLRDIEKIESYDAAQRKNIDIYGFLNIGESFHPHLTLTKYKDPIATELPSFNAKELTFTSDTLALMLVGEFGTGRELIDKYSI